MFSTGIAMFTRPTRGLSTYGYPSVLEDSITTRSGAGLTLGEALSVNNGVNPSSDTFALKVNGRGTNSNRTAYFEGSTGASVWWGANTTPHAAIDSTMAATLGKMEFWAYSTAGAGSWTQAGFIQTSGLTVTGTGTFQGTGTSSFAGRLNSPQFWGTNDVYTDSAFVADVDGDTVPRWVLKSSGLQEWGAGGASARDTNLYRSAANILKTDDSFTVGGAFDGLGTGTNTLAGPLHASSYFRAIRPDDSASSRDFFTGWRGANPEFYINNDTGYHTTIGVYNAGVAVPVLTLNRTTGIADFKKSVRVVNNDAFKSFDTGGAEQTLCALLSTDVLVVGNSNHRTNIRTTEGVFTAGSPTTNGSVTLTINGTTYNFMTT